MVFNNKIIQKLIGSVSSVLLPVALLTLTLGNVIFFPKKAYSATSKMPTPSSRTYYDEEHKSNQAMVVRQIPGQITTVANLRVSPRPFLVGSTNLRESAIKTTASLRRAQSLAAT